MLKRGRAFIWIVNPHFPSEKLQSKKWNKKPYEMQKSCANIIKLGEKGKEGRMAREGRWIWASEKNAAWGLRRR
jgi:hypothetical protein